MTDPRKRSERRYCHRKGCRGWWVHDPSKKRTSHTPRRYCKKCSSSWDRWLNEVASPEALQRKIVRNRKNVAGIREDRVGLPIDRPRYPSVPCDRCLARPARKGFSFCMKCSVCTSCGKNKPKTGVSKCRACSLSQEARRRAKRELPGEREKIAAAEYAYRQRPEIKARRSERNKKRYERQASDPKLWEKKLASDRKHKRIARLRVLAVMDKRICARPGCTQCLVGRDAKAIYCSDTCRCRRRRRYSPIERSLRKGRITARNKSIREDPRTNAELASEHGLTARHIGTIRSGVVAA